MPSAILSANDNENAQIVGNEQEKPEKQRAYLTYKISNPLTFKSCQPH